MRRGDGKSGWRVIFWGRFIGGGRFIQGGYTYIHLRWLCPCCVWCKHRDQETRITYCNGSINWMLYENATAVIRHRWYSTIQLILKLNDGQMDWQFHFQTLRRWMRLIRRAGWLTRCLLTSRFITYKKCFLC